MKKYGFGGESSTYVFVAAVAIFSAIFGFSFGATWRGSVSESAPFGWAEFWLNRYQTGLTIIVAVLIAKQQLDSARKQHIAQVKRSFKGQLDAIRAVRKAMSSLTERTFDEIVENSKRESVFFWLLDKSEIELIERELPGGISVHSIGCAEHLAKFIDEFYGNKKDQHSLRTSYNLLQKRAMYTLQLADRSYDELSEYWS